ncbi:hypothetical protein K443DRAFT_13448 [Laccaria amethystina LaAM-08-1]|uniref:Uncharacterized protein n=1 Tax=Laccaria amethystina LaAM-08-1 TaxID=1095629 RepID=A0A0C9WVD0_9AGAR|nr:hypothetical protein K443DRAFT_13448 [Laccaria amethystina LaAM-08-1]
MAAFGDEMSEGSARITREIQHKVRTPLLAPRSHSSVSGSVPLEFDEEDGNFLGGGVGALFDVPVPLPQQREGSSASPGTSRYDGDIWQGWHYEDKVAIEEAERFDDISAVGFLDAGQEASKSIATAGSEGRKQKRRKH